MRRLSTIALLAGIGYVLLTSETNPPAEPVIIETPSATVVEVQTPPIGSGEESEASDVTTAKAEVQSLTWQLEVIKEQLEESQAKLDTNASSMSDTPVMEASPVVRATPRGHYEYKRTGLFRRKRVWVNE